MKTKTFKEFYPSASTSSRNQLLVIDILFAHLEENLELFPYCYFILSVRVFHAHLLVRIVNCKGCAR